MSNYLSSKLKDIPYILNIHEAVYKLRGVIGMKASGDLKISSIGHYVAFIKQECQSQWEVFDDTNPKNCMELVSGRDTVHIDSLLYTL